MMLFMFDLQKLLNVNFHKNALSRKKELKELKIGAGGTTLSHQVKINNLWRQSILTL